MEANPGQNASLEPLFPHFGGCFGFPLFSLVPGFVGPFAAVSSLARRFRLFLGASSVGIAALGSREIRDPGPWG